MRREIVKTSDAPAAIGPYNQAVWTSGGRTLYLSGQIALDPATGDIVGEDQTRTVGIDTIREEVDRMVRGVGVQRGGQRAAKGR